MKLHKVSYWVKVLYWDSERCISLTSRFLSVFILYDSLNAVFDKKSFQMSEDNSCLFTTSIWQGAKKCMLLIALGLPEDMIYYSFLALDV